MKNKIQFFSWLLLVPLFLSLLFPAHNKFDTFASLYLPFISFACVFLVLTVDVLYSYRLHRQTSRQIRFLHGLAFTLAVFVTLSFFLSQTKNVGYGEVLMTWTCVLLFQLSPRVWNPPLLVGGGIALLGLSSFGGLFLYLTSSHQRLFGFFFHPSIYTDAWPNAFALLVLLLWPLLLLWKPTHIWPKLLKFFIFTTSIAALFCSFSRAALGVFFLQLLSLLFFSLLKCRQRGHPFQSYVKKFLSFLGIALVTLLITLGTLFLRHEVFLRPTPYFVEKIQFAKGEEVTSIQERFHFWEGSLTLIAQEPLFGFGPMSFGYVFRTIQPGWLEISDHPHNMFLKLGAESGIPSALALIIILIVLLVSTIVQWRNFSEENRTALGIVWVSLGGAIVHNLVDYNLNFVNTALLFWLGLLSLQHLLFTSSQKTKKAFPVLKIAALILSLYFASLAIYPYLYDRLQGEAFPHDQRTYFPRYALLVEGDRQRDSGNIDAARQVYELHLQKNSFDATGYSRMGELYRKLQAPDKALPYFQRALELDPRNDWIHYRNYFETLMILDARNQIFTFIPAFLQEVRLYLPRLQANLHYTAQKPDVQNLLQLVILLQQVDSTNGDLYLTLEKEIRAALFKFAKS